MVHQRLWFNSSIIGLFLILTNTANSQIVPDGTTSDTSVSGNCQISCDITGGNLAGQNLFHSFEEFSILTGENVYFTDPGVANIFSRVTGNSSSSIFGTLGVSAGDANLFLLNPNGIMFGKGAALDLNGSFFATTADEIQFGDRGFFSASPNTIENTALLTINPSALFFNQTGQNGAILLDEASLTLPAQNNLTFLGQGDEHPGILLKNSTINSYEGNITLGAVEGSAIVGIQDNFQLKFSEPVIKGNIALTEASSLTATNLGNVTDKEINLDANNLEIRADSKISTIASMLKGADINIKTQEAVKIIGDGQNAFQQFLAENLTPRGSTNLISSGLQTSTAGAGNAGNINIVAADLALRDGAGIVSSTTSQGTTGSITTDITNTFVAKSSGLLTGSTTFSLGGVGGIEINSNQLLVEQGGVISASTLGKGNAGNLTVNASESIQIRETLPSSIVATGIFSNTIFGSGKAGNLNIATPNLVLQDGGQLSSSSGAITRQGLIPLGGKGGSISIDAPESIKVVGASADGIFPSAILSDTRSASLAGNLTIDTNNLVLDTGGFISASSVGTGAGGNITINASDSVQLNGTGIGNLQQLITDGLTGQLDPANVQGGIAAFTIRDGVAGDITLNTSSLNLENGAIISTATYSNDDAGNLQIYASANIDVRGSAIVSPTFGGGNGGTLDLKTENLSVTEGGAIASASVGSGKAGNLNVLATESISIFSTVPDLLFSGSISTGNYSGLGLSGNLNIETQRLTIRDGANIQANNVFIVPPDPNSTPSEAITNNQGKLTINASESIEISGSTFRGSSFNDTPNSHVSSLTTTSNPASNVIINTGKLSVFDGGEINVSGLGEGAAGRLSINADSIILKNEGSLSGTTNSGQGGNIDLRVTDILSLEEHSVIDTNAIALGNGGNIDIKANFVIASGNSLISANAAAIGNGGNIDITAKDVFLTTDSQITADSALGLDGTVKVKTLVDTEQNNDTKLPQQVIQANSKITRSCRNNGRQGVFSYTGRGGLPFNPLTDFQSSDVVIADFEVLNRSSSNKFVASNKTLSVPEQLVEAEQWQINAQGKVELVAFADNKTTIPSFNSANCPFSNL